MRLFRIGKIWHVRWTSGNQRQQRSTGETARGKAEALALRWVEESKTRAVGGEPMVTLGKLRERWLEAHAKTAGLRHWDNVNRWLDGGLGTVMVDRVSTELVALARTRLIETRNWRPATANGWLRVLDLLGGFAIRIKMISTRPWDVPVVRETRRAKATLPPLQTKAFLDALDASSRNPQVGTAVRLIIGLGLRESEAVRARWEWLDQEQRTYTPGDTKGGEAMPIPVPGWLLEHLQQIHQGIGLMLPTKDGHAHPPQFTRASIRAAAKALGIHGLSVHRLRGTFITELLRDGVPPVEVQKLARHKDLRTTMGYYEDAGEVRREAVEALARKQGLA